MTNLTVTSFMCVYVYVGLRFKTRESNVFFMLLLIFRCKCSCFFCAISDSVQMYVRSFLYPMILPGCSNTDSKLTFRMVYRMAHLLLRVRARAFFSLSPSPPSHASLSPPPTPPFTLVPHLLSCARVSARQCVHQSLRLTFSVKSTMKKTCKQFKNQKCPKSCNTFTKQQQQQQQLYPI